MSLPACDRGRRAARPPIGAAVIAAAVFAIAGAAADAAAALPPLIPREVLFSEAEQRAPALSPDGARLAWLRRGESGRMRIWIETLGRDDAAPVLPDTGRGIPDFQWAADGGHLLFLQDSDGDENWHLYSVDLATRSVRDMTPYPGVRAENLLANARQPDEVLIGLNRRDPRVSDMHRVRLSTGEITLDTENPGDVVSWTTDSQFRIRAATALDPKDGSTMLRVRDGTNAPWRDLVHWSFEDAGNDRYQRILGFAPGDTALYVQDPAGSNTTRLVTLSTRDGRLLSVIAGDPRADLWNDYVPTRPEFEVVAMFDRRTGRPRAVASHHLQPDWIVLDPVLAADFAALKKLQRGVLAPLGADTLDRRWIVGFWRDDGPAAFWLWDRETRKARRLFETKPVYARYTLARTRPLTIRARDGIELPSYLTLPPGVPARGLPLVLLVHGGPWYRDEWSFQVEKQWLANRGYAVLQVNFRGSSGFGRDFLNAADHQMGVGAMQHDLTDAVRWAIREGLADPGRVAIMGGSYGGYATLCGLAFTPELYACGVDIVGPADLKRLIESFPPYWAPRRQRWLNRIGNVVEDEDLNRRLSPYFHVEKIRAPLLIGQGANDPRVRIAQSDSMVAALRAHGREVDYVIYPDEGHGFGRTENHLDFWGRAEKFLARHLGGRAEPWGEVPGSSAQVK